MNMAVLRYNDHFARSSLDNITVGLDLKCSFKNDIHLVICQSPFKSRMIDAHDTSAKILIIFNAGDISHEYGI